MLPETYRPATAASSAVTATLTPLGKPSALGAGVIPNLAHETVLPQPAALDDDVDAELGELDAFAGAHAPAGFAALHQLGQCHEGHLGAVGMHAGDRAGVAGVDGHQVVVDLVAGAQLGHEDPVRPLALRAGQQLPRADCGKTLAAL